MRINVNRKGKVGERELAALFREYGIEARRSKQYCGVTGEQDLKHALEGYYIECKRVKDLYINKAFEQIEKDAKDTGIPIRRHLLFARTNRLKWLLIVRPVDLFPFHIERAYEEFGDLNILKKDDIKGTEDTVDIEYLINLAELNQNYVVFGARTFLFNYTGHIHGNYSRTF